MAIIIPALLTIPIVPFYLMTGDYTMIVVFFTIQGAFGGGGMHVLYPLTSPRDSRPRCAQLRAASFITRARYLVASRSGHHLFCPELATGFAVPMAVGTILGCISVALAVFAGPETRASNIVAELSVA